MWDSQTAYESKNWWGFQKTPDEKYRNNDEYRKLNISAEV